MQAQFKSGARTSIDYTPNAGKSAGDVVVVGFQPGVVAMDVAANQLGSLDITGVFAVVKDGTAFAQGDAVFWDAAGDPVGGLANSGAATGSGVFLGLAAAACETGDARVQVILNEATYSFITD